MYKFLFKLFLIFIIKFIFFKLLVLFFIHFERVNGLKSSSLLFVFWLFSFISSLILIRSAILQFIESVKFNFSFHGNFLILNYVSIETTK
jgi:hypothetical protein